MEKINIDWDYCDVLVKSELPELKNIPETISMATEFKEVPGLSLLYDAITISDEEKILTQINKKEWVKAFGGREVQQYGRLYNYNTKALGESTPMPAWLVKLSRNLDLPTPENVIINKYEPGEGITQHTDNMCFGDVIASLSLISPITMDLKFNALEHHIRLEPRSLLRLTGEARTLWTHGIVGRKSDVVDNVKVPRQTRYSITFRTLA